MTTSDLRINNLILTPKEAGGKPFLRSIVQEIKANSVIVDGDREVKIEDCAGIEITEDWLRGFGFENKGTFSNKVRLPDNPPTDMDGATKYERDYCRIYLEKGKFHYEISTCYDDVSDRIETIEIQYVHRLQNLHYTLKGQELAVVSPASAQ